MKAKDIMAPITVWLSPDDTLKVAVNRMREARRWHGLCERGLVVLGKDKKMVGIIAIKDILRSTLPPWLGVELGDFTWDGMLEEHARKAAGVLVREIMSTEVVTVHPEDSLMKCADLLIRKGLQRLPVVDGQGQVVGMIHIRDVYAVISKIFHDTPEDTP